MTMKDNKGFTLVELLVVITIIATLAAFLFSNFAGARERARDVKRKSDLSQVKNALRLYYNDTQSYPTAGSGNIIGTYAWGATFTIGSTVYMSQLPLDPLNDATHKYRYFSNATNTDNFLIVSTLENGGDPDAAKSQAQCSLELSWASPPVGTNDYVVCAE